MLLTYNRDAIQYAVNAAGRLDDVFTPFRQASGLKAFGYGRLYQDNNLLSVCSSMKWCKLYYYNGFFEKMDFTESRTREPATEGTSYMLFTGKPQSLYHKALVSIDLWNTFNLYNQTEKYLEVFSFSASTTSENIVNFYINNIDIIWSFIKFFQNQCENIINTQSQSHLISYQPPALTLNRQQTSAYEQRDMILDQIKLGRYYLTGKDKTSYITSREAECLHLLSEGCGIKRVAEIMNISPRTAQNLLTNAKQRNNCLYKQQLIEIFKDNNLDKMKTKSIE